MTDLWRAARRLRRCGCGRGCVRCGVNGQFGTHGAAARTTGADLDALAVNHSHIVHRLAEKLARQLLLQRLAEEVCDAGLH